MRYFQPHEFACRCGCGKGFADMDPHLLALLDAARDKAGLPMQLTSAFRCPAHNRAVGGVADSSHTKGMAVDIRCADSRSRFVLIPTLVAVGFRRIEAAPTWIHVDVDPDKPQDVLFYQPGGRY